MPDTHLEKHEFQKINIHIF